MSAQTGTTIKNIFITGKPGTGKTTLIIDLIKELGLDAGGFYTREVREAGKRVGFDIHTLDDKTGALARKGEKSLYRVGSYGVDLRSLDTLGVSSIESALAAGKPVVIDEIGKMELFSERFKAVVLAAIDRTVPVLGTIKLTGDPLTDAIKKRSDTIVIELTPENRMDTKKHVRELLEAVP